NFFIVIQIDDCEYRLFIMITYLQITLLRSLKQIEEPLFFSYGNLKCFSSQLDPLIRLVFFYQRNQLFRKDMEGFTNQCIYISGQVIHKRIGPFDKVIFIK